MSAAGGYGMQNQSEEFKGSDRAIAHWTMIGVIATIIIQVITGAWVVSAMYTRIGDLDVRVTQIEQTKENVDTLTPQLEEINRRLGVIETKVLGDK